MIQGDQGSIFCKADGTLDFCRWQKDDFNCKVSSGQQQNCGPMSAVIEEDTCVLRYDQGIVHNDAGTYTCILYQGKDIDEGKDFLPMQLIKMFLQLVFIKWFILFVIFGL